MSIETKPKGYLPTLDGWRALAILAVIFHHDGVHTLGRFNTSWIVYHGAAGVDVFFAISGILICSRLLDEEQTRGRIDLGNFYIRRAWRILPAACLYLFTIGILAWLGVIPSAPRGWLEAMFFCRNLPSTFGAMSEPVTGLWYHGHFWSLALEEQFYFVLPALIVFTPRRFRAGLLAALSTIVAVHRALALHHRPWELMEAHPDVRLDALLVPAFFAVIASSPKGREWFRHALRFWPLLVVAGLCLIPYGVGSAWHITLFVLLMPCIVLGSVLNPRNVFGKFLEWNPLRWVGRISYSLYLWQQLFFTGHFLPGFEPLGTLQSWPLRLLMTFACAYGSYRLVEHPLVRLGHRLTKSRISSGVPTAPSVVS